MFNDFSISSVPSFAVPNKKLDRIFFSSNPILSNTYKLNEVFISFISSTYLDFYISTLILPQSMKYLKPSSDLFFYIFTFFYLSRSVTNQLDTNAGKKCIQRMMMGMPKGSINKDPIMGNLYKSDFVWYLLLSIC